MSDTFDGRNPLAESIRNAAIGAFAQQSVGATVNVFTPGAAASVPAGGRGELLLNTAPAAPLLLPANTPLVFDNQPAAATLIAAGGDGQGVVAHGGLTYDLHGGSGVFYTGAGQAGDLLYVTGTQPSTVAAGSGADTVVAAGGNALIGLGGGANLAFLASGQDTLASEGNDTVVMGQATATLSFTGQSVVFGGSGALAVQFGAGVGQFWAAGGAATLTTGSGADLFGFAAGHAGGSYEIAGFRPGTDHVLLGGYDSDGASAARAAEAAAQAGAGGVTVTLSDNTRILFTGLAQLPAGSLIG